jgi:hypothetical protein
MHLPVDLQHSAFGWCFLLRARRLVPQLSASVNGTLLSQLSPVRMLPGWRQMVAKVPNAPYAARVHAFNLCVVSFADRQPQRRVQLV